MVSEQLYEFIKYLDLSLKENEKEKDLKRIRQCISSRTRKRVLEEMLEKLKGLEYSCLIDGNIYGELFLLDEWVNGEEYMRLNRDAYKHHNYFKMNTGQIKYKAKKKIDNYARTDKSIVKCLDELLGDSKDIFSWNEEYYFDIREIKKDNKRKLIYCEGTQARAKQIDKELNGLIKRIFIKKSHTYRKNIEMIDFERLEMLLLEILPVFDNYGEVKNRNLYIKQREEIRQRISLCAVQCKIKKTLNYKCELFELLLCMREEKERESIETQLALLNKIDKEAAYFLEKEIVKLNSLYVDIPMVLVEEYRKEVAKKIISKGLTRKVDSVKCQRDRESLLLQAIEVMEKDEYSQVCRNLEKSEDTLLVNLEKCDYETCYQRAVELWDSCK